MKVRLDKYLANLWIASRKEIAKMVKQGLISVNSEEVKKSDIKLTENDTIQILWDEIPVLENVTLILHKPAWYVSSDVDEAGHKSYKHLLEDCIFKNLLKVAWRLDVDTEGLLVVSSDWKFIHELISPKRWKKKIYYVETQNKLSQQDIEKLEKWVDIGDYVTLPAKVLKLPADSEKIKQFWNFKGSTLSQISSQPIKWQDAILLEIVEWKFHQIKRMLEAVWNKVVYLKRLKMWDFELEDLLPWSWRKVL